MHAFACMFLRKGLKWLTEQLFDEYVLSLCCCKKKDIIDNSANFKTCHFDQFCIGRSALSLIPRLARKRFENGSRD